MYTINSVINDLLENCYSYFTHGSGMVFKSMVSLDINTSGIKQKPSAMSTNHKKHTYGHRNFIEKFEITKLARKAVIDVQELTNHCLIYSVAANLKHTDYETLEDKENPANYMLFS